MRQSCTRSSGFSQIDEPAVIERHLAEIADPQAGDAKPVLVGIERADRLAEHLADAVAAVGARGDVGADPVMARIEADRVVRRGEHHALDAFFARRLEQIVAADDVGLQDLVPGAFDRIAAEMQDAVDAFADRLDLREIGEIGRLEFFVLAEIGRRLQIAQQQVRIDRRQQFAQRCADPAGGAGHQYAWHFFPLHLATDLRSLAGNDSKLKRSRKRNNENSKCPMHRPIPPAGVRRRYYPDPAIHALDPRFEKYWLKLSAVERLTTGLRWAEGPVWFGDGRYLLCSDIPNQRIIKWEEETGAVSIFRKPSNFANGNTRDRQGRLVTCEHGGRRVVAHRI